MEVMVSALKMTGLQINVYLQMTTLAILQIANKSNEMSNCVRILQYISRTA